MLTYINEFTLFLNQNLTQEVLNYTKNIYKQITYTKCINKKYSYNNITEGRGSTLLSLKQMAIITLYGNDTKQIRFDSIITKCRFIDSKQTALQLINTFSFKWKKQKQ